MESCGRFVNYPPSGFLINVIFSDPSHSLSGYWRVTRLLSVELRLFWHLSLRFFFISQVMVSLYSHSFLFDPVFRLLLASGFFS